MVWITSKMWGLLNVRVSQLERQKSLPADEITEAVRKYLKEELRTAGSVMDKKNEEHVYVSERITNISELERIIEKERNALSMLLSQLEKRIFRSMKCGKELKEFCSFIIRHPLLNFM